MVSTANRRESPRMMTPAEVADELRVSRLTLAEWRQEPGRGPDFVRLGYRTVRYERSAVRRFTRERRNRSTY